MEKVIALHSPVNFVAKFTPYDLSRGMRVLYLGADAPSSYWTITQVRHSHQRGHATVVLRNGSARRSVGVNYFCQSALWQLEA